MRIRVPPCWGSRQMPKRQVVLCERGLAGDGGSARNDGVASDEHLLRVMRKLARRGVVLVPTEDVESKGVRACLVDSLSGRGVEGGGVERVVWRALYEGGDIVVGEAGPGWRLSQSGHVHLKRLLSRSRDTVCTRGAQETTDRDVSERGAGARRALSKGKGGYVSNDSSPLGWLRQRRDGQGRALISAVEYSAGERLRADFVIGQMTPRTTMNWDAAGGGGQGGSWRDGELTASEAALAARERVRRALRAVGDDFSTVLFDVCCCEIGLTQVEHKARWPRRAGKVVLQMALRALARHYGFIARD